MTKAGRVGQVYPLSSVHEAIRMTTCLHRGAATRIVLFSAGCLACRWPKVHSMNYRGSARMREIIDRRFGSSEQPYVSTLSIDVRLMSSNRGAGSTASVPVGDSQYFGRSRRSLRTVSNVSSPSVYRLLPRRSRDTNLRVGGVAV